MSHGVPFAVCHSVGCRQDSDPMLLWCRLASEALIRPLARELPYAAGLALKKQKKKEEEEGEGEEGEGEGEGEEKEKKKKLLLQDSYCCCLKPEGIGKGFGTNAPQMSLSHVDYFELKATQTL